MIQKSNRKGSFSSNLEGGRFHPGEPGSVPHGLPSVVEILVTTHSDKHEPSGPGIVHDPDFRRSWRAQSVVGRFIVNIVSSHLSGRHLDVLLL